MRLMTIILVTLSPGSFQVTSLALDVTPVPSRTRPNLKAGRRSPFPPTSFQTPFPYIRILELILGVDRPRTTNPPETHPLLATQPETPAPAHPSAYSYSPSPQPPLFLQAPIPPLGPLMAAPTPNPAFPHPHRFTLPATPPLHSRHPRPLRPPTHPARSSSHISPPPSLSRPPTPSILTHHPPAPQPLPAPTATHPPSPRQL